MIDTLPLVVAPLAAVTTKTFALVTEETIYVPSAEEPEVKSITIESPANNLWFVIVIVIVVLLCA